MNDDDPIPDVGVLIAVVIGGIALAAFLHHIGAL